MSCSFSGTDNNADYFSSVGYHLSAVYRMVLEYPTLDLRYFVNPYKKSRELTQHTICEDEVFFSEEDIFESSNEANISKYDLNLFAKHVGVGEDILFKTLKN